MNKNEKPKYGFIDKTRMRIAKRIDDYMLKDNLDSYRNAIVNSDKLTKKYKLSDEDNHKFADLIGKRNRDIAVVSSIKGKKDPWSIDTAYITNPKLKKRLQKDKRVALIQNSGGNKATFLHELGHARRGSGSEGKIAKYIHENSKKSGGSLISNPAFLNIFGDKNKRKNGVTREEYIKALNKMKIPHGYDINKDPKLRIYVKDDLYNSSGIKTGVKNSYYAMLKYLEERGASKYAKKHFKDYNLSDDEAKIGNKITKECLNTYTPELKNRALIPFRNMIQIESKRGDFGPHVYKDLDL